MSDEVEVMTEDGETRLVPAAVVERAAAVARPERPVPVHSAEWTVQEIVRFAATVKDTDFVPRGLRGNGPAVAACIMYGREIGLEPMNSLRHVMIVEGQPVISAQLMRSMIVGAGHRFRVDEWDDEHCTVTGTRRDSGDSLTITWSLRDAERAGLCRVEEGKAVARSQSGKKLPWETYTRQMLLARATSDLARGLFADVLGPAQYTADDLDGEAL